MVGIDGEVFLVLTGDKLISCRNDGLGNGAIDDVELLVCYCRRPLHFGKRDDVAGLEPLSGDGKVLDCALGLCPVQRLPGNFDLTHRVVFDAELVAHHCLSLGRRWWG